MTLITRFSFTLALSASLEACTSVQVVHRPIALPLPERPVLERVEAPAVQCLSDEAYSKLVKRQSALKVWGLKLEAVIKANNKEAEGRN